MDLVTALQERKIIKAMQMSHTMAANYNHLINLLDDKFEHKGDNTVELFLIVYRETPTVVAKRAELLALEARRKKWERISCYDCRLSYRRLLSRHRVVLDKYCHVHKKMLTSLLDKFDELIKFEDLIV